MDDIATHLAMIQIIHAVLQKLQIKSSSVDQNVASKVWQRMAYL